MQWKCIGSVAVATWDPVPTILMVTTESPTAQSLPCHACQSISLSSVYASICPSIISVSGSGLHPRAILPPQPQGLLAMSRDIFGPHHWVGGRYWDLVGAEGMLLNTPQRTGHTIPENLSNPECHECQA